MPQERTSLCTQLSKITSIRRAMRAFSQHNRVRCTCSRQPGSRTVDTEGGNFAGIAAPCPADRGRVQSFLPQIAKTPLQNLISHKVRRCFVRNRVPMYHVALGKKVRNIRIFFYSRLACAESSRAQMPVSIGESCMTSAWCAHDRATSE